MKFISATNLNRKSGAAKRTCPGVPWRNLRCAIRVPHIYGSTTTLPLSSSTPHIRYFTRTVGSTDNPGRNK
jgi:hypothetical protein